MDVRLEKHRIDSLLPTILNNSPEQNDGITCTLVTASRLASRLTRDRRWVETAIEHVNKPQMTHGSCLCQVRMVEFIISVVFHSPIP